MEVCLPWVTNTCANHPFGLSAKSPPFTLVIQVKILHSMLSLRYYCQCIHHDACGKAVDVYVMMLLMLTDVIIMNTVCWLSLNMEINHFSGMMLICFCEETIFFLTIDLYMNDPLVRCYWYRCDLVIDIQSHIDCEYLIRQSLLAQSKVGNKSLFSRTMLLYATPVFR